MTGTYDPNTNTIFWGTANPAPDYDINMRPGDNLWAFGLAAGQNEPGHRYGRPGADHVTGARPDEHVHSPDESAVSIAVPRRLGFDADATRFFDEHVEADAVHEAVAATDLAGALAEDEGLAWEILFGAHALQATEGLAGAQQLDAWKSGRSSLLPPSRPARHLAAIP